MNAVPVTDLRDALQRLILLWRSMADAPPPDAEGFRSRILFVERGIIVPVKAVLIGLMIYALFVAGWFDNLTEPRTDALRIVRTMFLGYFVLNVGLGFLLWGADDISPRLLARAVYSMAILDGVGLAALTLITGGFDSILYWVFLGLIIRNAAVIPLADVQIVVNLLVSVFYLIAGTLDLSLSVLEIDLVATTGRGRLELVTDGPSGPVEPLLLRLLLMVLMTACCYGIQVLVDRHRREAFEANEFAAKQEQLQAAGRLAAEIAHQLKNPLGIINNAAYSLARSGRDQPEVQRQVGIIREEVARSDRILTELMGYAQLAEGKVERVALGEVLDAAVELVFPEGNQFGIGVVREDGPALPPLLGQRIHFVEIFANLLTNARDALAEGGTVWIRARGASDYSVVVEIADDGPGIPAEVQSQLFEAYFTTKEKGTGLGLAIVRHNAEIYGGTVGVRSGVGRGTTFTVTLPARSPLRFRR